MRTAFLLLGMSAYLDASFRALAAVGHEILLVYPSAMVNAPYDGSGFAGYATTRLWDGDKPPADTSALLADFDPDAVVMAGWHLEPYRRAMKDNPSDALRVLFMDNVWNGTAKQWLGRVTHRVYIEPYFDCVFVPGDRQEYFARRLGFGPGNIIRGGYTADVPSFDRGPRDAREIAGRRAFLFAGRLVPQKGTRVLAQAFDDYRRSQPEPWSLHVAGTGPEAEVLARVDGVTMHGFMQPHDLTELMHRSSCLIFPSLDEHYGVLVHEAAAAGLPLLCTDVAGVAPMMVQDAHNGWVLPAGSAKHWAQGMAAVSSLPAAELAAMSDRSRQMASRFSPQGWATNLDGSLRRLIADTGRRRG